MRTLEQAQTSLTDRLEQAGFRLAPLALTPLRQIDFAKLVEIHDHEEAYLEETFFQLLVTLPRARTSPLADRDLISAEDVETALRMLGVAAARQPEHTLTRMSKGVIRDACGFC